MFSTVSICFKLLTQDDLSNESRRRPPSTPPATPASLTPCCRASIIHISSRIQRGVAGGSRGINKSKPTGSDARSCDRISHLHIPSSWRFARVFIGFAEPVSAGSARSPRISRCRADLRHRRRPREASTHHPHGFVCVCVCWAEAGVLCEGHVGVEGSASRQCFTSNSHFKRNLQTAEQPGPSTLVWDAGKQMPISQRKKIK